MPPRRGYWAFLSYSHSDAAWARWLHRALETYPVPRALVGRPTSNGPAPRRLQPIFRDREELAADANLRERIREALETSAFLIVICSPAAARSQWVDEEIARFKRINGDAAVLAVIVGGKPHSSELAGHEAEECFPPALRQRADGAGAAAPARADLIAADLRPEGDGRRLATLKLLARMLEVRLDDLGRRDAQRRGRRLLVLTASSAGITLAMTALAIGALVSRNQAKAERNQAEGLVAFMLGDLREKLEPLGRLDLLDAVGSRAMAYYAFRGNNGADDKALGKRARVLHLLGDIADKRGNLALALRDFQEAAATTGRLLARRPNDEERIFNHAQSVYYEGNVAYERGEDDAALVYFREYSRLADRLVRLNPKKAGWQAEVADADVDLAQILTTSHRNQAALTRFRRALQIDEHLVLTQPFNRRTTINLAQVHAFVSDAELETRADSLGMNDRLAERRIYLDLLARSADDIDAAEGLVVNRIAVGNLYLRRGRLDVSVHEFTSASMGAEKLLAVDRENSAFQGYAASAFTALGQALLRRGAIKLAAAAARRASVLAETIAKKDPTVEEWRGIRLGRARLLRIEVDAEAAGDRNACRAALAPSVEESNRLAKLAASEPDDAPLAAVTAEGGLLAGDYQAVAGEPTKARAAWRGALRWLNKPLLTDASPAFDRVRAVRVKIQQGANVPAYAHEIVNACRLPAKQSTRHKLSPFVM